MFRLGLLAIVCVLPGPLLAATPAEFAARARLAYQQARALHVQSPKDLQLSWQFGRACYDVADFSTNNTERADFAEQGMAACKAVIAADRDSAASHYYLGMNLGQLAQTRGLSALKLVDQMEAEFKIARQLDEHFDFGGPDRNLGLLYRDAPSWISIGSRNRAAKHLLRAVQLAPDYPENRLNLLESYVKWDDHNGIKREMKLVDELWPKARKQFSGSQWELSWADWTDRLQQVKKKINEPPRAIESPRGSEQP
jgi:tetratricopeptide (TPR) repeat protein